MALWTNGPLTTDVGYDVDHTPTPSQGGQSRGNLKASVLARTHGVCLDRYVWVGSGGNLDGDLGVWQLRDHRDPGRPALPSPGLPARGLRLRQGWGKHLTVIAGAVEGYLPQYPIPHAFHDFSLTVCFLVRRQVWVKCVQSVGFMLSWTGCILSWQVVLGGLDVQLTARLL